MTVEETASLHESSVTGAQELVGTFARPRARAKAGRSSRVRQRPVADPRVWAAARQLQAARPGSRLRVVDFTTVLVE